MLTFVIACQMAFDKKVSIIIEEGTKLNRVGNYHHACYTPEYISISLLSNVDFQK